MRTLARNSSDSQDLEMENWVEPGRPRNQREKETDFILQHKIFEVRPYRGVLPKRGSSTTVVIT